MNRIAEHETKKHYKRAEKMREKTELMLAGHPASCRAPWFSGSDPARDDHGEKASDAVKPLDPPDTKAEQVINRLGKNFPVCPDCGKVLDK